MEHLITYASANLPVPGKLQEIAPGLFWLRLAMPLSLDHINLWLIEQPDSWVVIDTGLNLKASKLVWQQVIAKQLKDKPISQVICTHMHPDHLGLAGWLCQQHDAQLLMSQGEYQTYHAITEKIKNKDYISDYQFFERGGISPDLLKYYDKFIRIFDCFVAPLPSDYVRLAANDKLTIGDYEWQVIAGRGHSPEHISLWCKSLNLYISGDQLLPTISSNISVHSELPEADPLAQWVASYQEMLGLLDNDTLVLPAHGKPFYGACNRIEQQLADIETSLASLLDFCQSPHCVTDAFPVLFNSKIDAANLFMAFGEAQAHFNCLVERGLITKVSGQNTLVQYQVS